MLMQQCNPDHQEALWARENCVCAIKKASCLVCLASIDSGVMFLSCTQKS